jgi:hypothetical protein
MNMKTNKDKVGARYIIDRFEGEYAVCEPDGATGHIDIPKKQIDKCAGEGAVIYYCEREKKYAYDADATKLRNEYIRNIVKDMWK